MRIYHDADVATVFGALAEPTRRHVVELLGAGPLRAGELAEASGTSGPAMSRHLRLLLDVGIVTDERAAADARHRVFRLHPESMVPLRTWLDELQARWDQQLQSFKQHVDGRHPQ